MIAQPERAQIPVLQMTDVAAASIHAPHKIVIDHIDWTVQAGEYWVVAGLPASGKSDLLSTAAALMGPARGVVRLFGKDMARLPEDQRVATQLRVGMVFGYGGRVFNHLTVSENLALPLCYHRNCQPLATEPRVRAVLELMELNEIAHNTPVMINRSQRQRVALARALVLAPELLFLDNPLAAIDPRESRWWLDFLDALLKGHPIVDGRSITLVVTTDDLLPWSKHGRQFGFLHDQRLTLVGSQSELLKEKNPALRELLPVAWLGE